MTSDGPSPPPVPWITTAGWFTRRRDTAARLRAGIILVATAAVLLTALPLLVYSLLTGATLERQRSDLIGEVVAQNLLNVVQNLHTDVEALATSPVVATALTDSAGREGYLRPFLQQRADSLRATMVLLDYRDRELLRVTPSFAQAEEPAEQPPINLQSRRDEHLSIINGDHLVHREPIVFFVNQRVIGSLEARLPLATLLAQATRGFSNEFDFAILRGGAIRAGQSDAGMATARRGPVTVVPAEVGMPAVQIDLAYRPRTGHLPHFLAGSAVLILVMVLLSLVLATLAARRMARKLTKPLALLVAASERFRAGEIPDLQGVQSVTEIAQLGQALTDAFVARDEAQREVRRYTERMLEGLPVAVFSGDLRADGDFTLDYISPGATRITGWQPDALHNLQDFVDKATPYAGQLLKEAMQQAFAAGAATLDYPLRRADGSASWLLLRVRVTERKGDGSPATIAGTLTDVTEERRIAEQAANAAKLATLGEMATGLAHELNQPLAVITMAAENTLRSLERNDPARLPDVPERLQRIVRQAMRARAIVDHLRIFGRNEAEALGAIQLQEAIEGAKILVGGLLRESGITLQENLPPDLPAVYGGLVPAEQVIVNLLVNARDAIRDAGSVPGEVTLSAEVSGDMLVLSVRDSGPGFRPELLPHIFEPFFTTKEVGKGTGLGLSICHGTMRSFGGMIEARNHPQGGAEFRLSFRLAHEVGMPGDATPTEAQPA